MLEGSGVFRASVTRVTLSLAQWAVEAPSDAVNSWQGTSPDSAASLRLLVPRRKGWLPDLLVLGTVLLPWLWSCQDGGTINTMLPFFCRGHLHREEKSVSLERNPDV